MPLIVTGAIPDDTCYPATLGELAELLAPVLSAGSDDISTTRVVYIQTSQPTGVPEETIWLEPVSKVVKYYGKAPGDAVASWIEGVPSPASLTGSMMAEETVTERELSTEVRAKLASVAAATSNSVLALETFHGAGSWRANFFIMSDGTLRATGTSQYIYASVGRPKNGTGSVSSSDASVLPKRCGFSPPLNGDTVEKVYAAQSATFVVTAAGMVYSTGLNVTGQLGLGDTNTRTIFVRIDPAYFNDEPVTELAIGTGDGSNLSCYALTGAGKVYSWGHNYYGQLGLGGVTTNNTNQPTFPTYVAALSTDNAQIVSAGAGTAPGTTCKVAAYVRKTGGTVYGCGYNTDGNLGQGNTTNTSSFVQIDAVNLTDITHIAVAGDGDHISFYAVKDDGGDGEVWACGYNNKGQLGNGNTTAQSSPINPLSASGILVEDLKAFATVGNFSVFARLDDGTLRVWGSNAHKQLGLGSGAGTANVTSPATPTVEDIDSNVLFVEDVQVGGAGGKISAALLTRIFTGFDALAPRYDVYACGNNQYGQLGLGDATDRDEFLHVLVDTTAISEIKFGASCSHATNNTADLLIRLNNGGCLACGYDAATIGQLGVDATPAAISVPAVVNF